MSGPRRIGLTGGIGSGKTTVTRQLVALGATVIDADEISRALTGPHGRALPAIADRFGAAYVTSEGALDRARMRQLVFNNPDAKTTLETIIHPLVRERAEQLTRAAMTSNTPCVAYDIPLLVESGQWQISLHRIWVVDCLPETQIARVTRRSGLSRGDVERIIAAQAPRERRLAIADAVIYNEDLSLDALNAEVAALGKLIGL